MPSGAHCLRALSTPFWMPLGTRTFMAIPSVLHQSQTFGNRLPCRKLGLVKSATRVFSLIICWSGTVATPGTAGLRLPLRPTSTPSLVRGPFLHLNGPSHSHFHIPRSPALLAQSAMRPKPCQACKRSTALPLPRLLAIPAPSQVRSKASRTAWPLSGPSPVVFYGHSFLRAARRSCASTYLPAAVRLCIVCERAVSICRRSKAAQFRRLPPASSSPRSSSYGNPPQSKAFHLQSTNSSSRVVPLLCCSSDRFFWAAACGH